MATNDSTNPVEAFFDEFAATAPKFLAQVEAARTTPFGLSKLYNDYRTGVRAWIVISLIAVAAVPLIVLLAWRSSLWLLVALVPLPLIAYVALNYALIAHKRLAILQPLAAAQNQTFFADAAQRITAQKLAAEPRASE